MNKIVYVCEGTCGAHVSEEEHEKGITKCGDINCPMYSQIFRKMRECDSCGDIFPEDQSHTH